MKNYYTEAYYIYSRYLSEGEAGKANSIPDKSNDPQFAKVIVAAGTGAAGAVACMKYLNNAFSIRSVSRAAVDLRYAVNTSLQPNMGVFSMFANSIKMAVSKALHWVAKIAYNITKKIPALKSPIMEGSSYTYGSIFSMALVGAAVGAAIYGLYKFIKNRRKKTESVAAFNARKNREYKAILAETVAFFDNLDRLTELSGDDVKTTVVGKGSNQLTRTTYGGKITKVPELDKTERMLQMSKQGTNPNGYVSTSSLRESTGTVTKAGTTAAKEAPAKAEGFLNSVKEKVMEMWKNVTEWCSNNPKLATVIGICAALIACWYGVKKYKESQAKKAGAAQRA